MKRAQVEWTAGSSVAANARAFLPGMAAEFFAAGRRVNGGKVKLKALHQFRLRAKRFRYTLELFEPVYGPELAKRIDRLKTIQNLLGSINDCVESRALIRGMRGAGKKARVSAVLRLIDGRRENRTKKFLSFWKEDFDRPGEEEAWRRFLEEPASAQAAEGGA